MDHRLVDGAWRCCSLGSVRFPLSVAYSPNPSDSRPWVDHLLVDDAHGRELPGAGLVPVEGSRPRGQRVGRVAGTVVLAPIFLTVGVLAFLFTVGIGSLVFAWILWWQTQVASTAKGSRQRHDQQLRLHQGRVAADPRRLRARGGLPGLGPALGVLLRPAGGRAAGRADLRRRRPAGAVQGRPVGADQRAGVPATGSASGSGRS